MILLLMHLVNLAHPWSFQHALGADDNGDDDVRWSEKIAPLELSDRQPPQGGRRVTREASSMIIDYTYWWLISTYVNQSIASFRFVACLGEVVASAAKSWC